MAMRTAYVIGILVLATALGGCIASEAPPGGLDSVAGEPRVDDATGAIEGTVTDDGLSPIAGVQVASLDTALSASAVTDAAGRFVLSSIQPGKYQLVAQKLGFDTAARVVDVRAGEVALVQFTLMPIAVREPRTEFLIGEGYFACGGYFFGVLTWGNLHACVWDNHKPRFLFEAGQTDLMGIAQEVVWQQNTALTAKKLLTSIQYKPVCDPFCSQEDQWGGQNSESPARAYIDLESWAPKAAEDPIPLASMTFPGGDGPELVIVFQQRMTHYITIFYGEHGDIDRYTGIPDA